MSNYQNAKALILKFQDEMENATADSVADVLAKYTSDDYEFFWCASV